MSRKQSPPGPPEKEAPAPPAADTRPVTILVRTAVALAVTVALVALVSILLRGPATRLVAWTTGHLGLPGIFAAVLLADTLWLPVPPDLFLLGTVTGHVPAVPMIATLGTASVLAGSLAYLLGPQLARLPWVRPRVERLRPRGEAFFARYGVWAVAIAALTPLPYCVFAWFAGIYRMRYPKFFLASLCRVPRFVLYLGIFSLGWVH